MIVKTEAICLKNTRYGETSVICKMFTLEHGLSSFLIQGISRKSSSIKPSHIAPGNILELVIYQKPFSTLQRIKEIKVVNPIISIHTDMVKNSILQFMIEIIAKTNESDHKDVMVFDYIKLAILELEHTIENIAFYPLYFLCRYLQFSGWFPNLEVWDTGYVFNVREGKFTPPNLLPNSDELSENSSHHLYAFLAEIEKKTPLIELIIQHKKVLFNAMLLYYEIHLLKGNRIKSPAILAEVLA